MTVKKFLHLLSGDDYKIISRCEKRLQICFALIGACVLLIFCLCFAASFLAFINLFPNYLIGIPIALFFAWMITNIYLLLLYTLSKNVLPHKQAGKMRTISLAGRIAFVCFIAVIVSKPLEALVYARTLKTEISDYKQAKIAKYNELTSEFFEAETAELKRSAEQQKLVGNFNSQRRQEFERRLIENREEKQKLIEEMTGRVENSNFYVHGILILNSKYPACWLLTMLTASIFLAPAVLKNIVSEQCRYYVLKRKIETGLIREEYSVFKAKYSQILAENFAAERTYCETFADAPFDTVLKVDRTVFQSESDLLKELYNE